MRASESSSSSPNHNSEAEHAQNEYERLAQQALEAGDESQAMHLHLAAFEAATRMPQGPDQDAVGNLRAAWDCACKLKQRPLAEHIFEKLEPYLAPDEVCEFGAQLQRLALDKLEEFGLSRDDIDQVAEMLADDAMGLSSIMSLTPGAFNTKEPDAAPSDKAAAPEAPRGALATVSDKLATSGAGAARGQKPSEDECTYSDLVGFERSVDDMRQRGIGLGSDPEFRAFLDMLAHRHGIDNAPSTETMLFRSYAREDARHFMFATMGEMGLPTVRMYMEEGPYGMPVLCLVASSDFKSRVHLAREGFQSPGTLVLEDIDTWASPLSGDSDEYDIMSLAHLSRGAREAIALIRSAVDNPEVVVMASCASDGAFDDFFFDLLGPISVIDIDVPDEPERMAVWRDVAAMHPSMRYLDRAELVRLSSGMSRFDIYMAAREAVDQAFRESIKKRAFVPVMRENILDKVAAYQPLDSQEYREIEDAVVRSMQSTFDHIDELLEEEDQ